MAVTVQAGGIVDLSGTGPDVVTTGNRRLVKYDPRKVKLVFGGIPVHRGIASGTFITIERMKPSWKLIKGTDGEGTRVRTQDFSARLQLTLRPGAGTNDALSAISAADDLAGVFALPLLLTDRNGRSNYVAPIAFLNAPADRQYGTEEGAITWVFTCNTWLPFTGGFDRAAPPS